MEVVPAFPGRFRTPRGGRCSGVSEATFRAPHPIIRWRLTTAPGNISRMRSRWTFLLALSASHPLPQLAAAQSPARSATITVIVDAFGKQSDLHRDWGYAALVEHRGKRILFDTGNDSAGFYTNVQRLGIDLTRLDAVVISHRHGDHTAGLRRLLLINPSVPVYVPDDEAFGGPTPRRFFQQVVPELPPAQRYFGGSVPDVIPHGSAWNQERFIRVSDTAEIAPGFRLVRNIAPAQPFAETPEVSLAIETPDGQVVVAGCSHPGIERILASVAGRDRRISLVTGGLHLVNADGAHIEQLATRLRDHWQVDRLAPGHCTGEVAFLLLERLFGTRFLHAGVGAVLKH